jgi:hypothetical protein
VTAAPPGSSPRPWPSVISAARLPLLPPSRARPLTTLQASLHAADRPVAPPEGASDAGFRPGPFPGQAASLLPGLLAATRTGLTPASDDELTNTKNTMNYVTVSPPVLLGARKARASDQGSLGTGPRRGRRHAPVRQQDPRNSRGHATVEPPAGPAFMPVYLARSPYCCPRPASSKRRNDKRSGWRRQRRCCRQPISKAGRRSPAARIPYAILWSRR